MKIRFIGAINTVTGSCYLLETDNANILIDCGMYQGDSVEMLNYEKFQFDPASIDYVLLTHAHLDHSGLIPRLFKYGFKGKILLTHQTAALTRIILYDSAKLQEINNSHLKDPDTLQINESLYSSVEVDEAVKHMNSVDYFEKIKITDEMFVIFLPVGHILGAASVYVSVKGKTVLFSGDIGRVSQSLILSYFDCDLSNYKPEYIVMDSLYGGLAHPKRDETIDEMYRILSDAASSNGRVIIPSFSVHRAQEILELIKFGFQGRKVPKMKVYFDSPMASAVTKVYLNNPRLLKKGILYKGKIFNVDNFENEKNGKRTRLSFPELVNIKKANQSLKISKSLHSIIIAGSGMAEGGRVINHLYANLGDSRTVVMFVGFQAENTLGRALVDGAKEVIINHKKIPVKAKIIYLQGFSGHADTDELKDWLKCYNLKNLNTVFLTHSEPERRIDFKSILSGDGYKVSVPEPSESKDLI